MAAVDPEPAPPAGPTTPARALPTKPNWPLICLGGALVALFVGGVCLALFVGSNTVVSGGTSSGGTSAGPSTTTAKSVPSDSLLEAVLGAGAALIVVGVLYGRISTIKFPGGVELDLTADESAKVEEAIGAKAQPAEGTKLNAQGTAVATRLARQEARKLKTETGTLALSDGDVQKVTDWAIEQAASVSANVHSG
jgi:hypothetical protein